MTSKTLMWVALVVIGIIAIGAYFYPKVSEGNLGAALDCSGVSCFTTVGVLTSLQVDGTTKIGSSGTAQSNQVTTTCSVTGNTSITATSTGYAFCTGVTGLTSSDNVIAQFASSTGATTLLDNWVIVGAKASTTAGSVDLTVMNLTGTSRALAAVSKIGSSTTLWISH